MNIFLQLLDWDRWFTSDWSSGLSLKFQLRRRVMRYFAASTHCYRWYLRSSWCISSLWTREWVALIELCLFGFNMLSCFSWIFIDSKSLLDLVWCTSLRRTFASGSELSYWNRWRKSQLTTSNEEINLNWVQFLKISVDILWFMLEWQWALSWDQVSLKDFPFFSHHFN